MTKTAGDLIQELRNAQRWAGKKNPHQKLFAECEQAIGYLALRVNELEEEKAASATFLDSPNIKQATEDLLRESAVDLREAVEQAARSVT